jgi:hypothetical protein
MNYMSKCIFIAFSFVGFDYFFNNNYCLTNMFDNAERAELRAEFRKLHSRELCSLQSTKYR